IVGPTGAGKSTFIEALAQDPSLRISSNQLEGFTQSINTYSVMNVSRLGNQISLVDVPGFADTRISMTNIVSMLKTWMQESGAPDLGLILFFTPIHGVRLPGSHREVLRSFQALTGAKSAGNITIVTTMWDNLWGDSAKQRAESNFNQLRDSEFVDEGAQIIKFLNTQESALSVLNAAF
ncbi:P-loop containing nucleoside triphosphate hydrolase protein, partial [Panaeolus papilionaceus]